MGGNVGVACAVISRDRTGLGRKGVSMGAPVTRNLLNGGVNSMTRVAMPRNGVTLRMMGVSVWHWNESPCRTYLVLSVGIVTAVFDEVVTNRVPYCGITRGSGFFTFLSVGPLMGKRALMIPGRRMSCVFSLDSRSLTTVRMFTGRMTHTVRGTFPYGGINRTIVKLRIPRTRVRLVPVRGRSSVLFSGPGLGLSSRRFGSVTRTVGSSLWGVVAGWQGTSYRKHLFLFLLLSRGALVFSANPRAYRNFQPLRPSGRQRGWAL